MIVSQQNLYGFLCGALCSGSMPVRLVEWCSLQRVDARTAGWVADPARVDACTAGCVRPCRGSMSHASVATSTQTACIINSRRVLFRRTIATLQQIPDRCHDAHFSRGSHRSKLPTSPDGSRVLASARLQHFSWHGLSVNIRINSIPPCVRYYREEN